MVNHIKSKKHDEGKDRMKQKQAREADIANSWLSMTRRQTERGATLPED